MDAHAPPGGSKFVRGVPARNTVHGTPIEERQVPGVGANGDLPEPAPLTRTAARMSFFDKLSSKFGRKLVLSALLSQIIEKNINSVTSYSVWL